ncbi:MAG: GNAT family N-acetyltransferase, partial [Synergistaceae bacterium]|nr:GNAT family N-acetyltransferase [Synergistaceae bacterium]
MIRDPLSGDRDTFLTMARDFYASGATAHPVDPKNFAATFAAAMEGSPFVRLLMIEDEEKPIGYALLSFTYSNEMGGMVVWIEELYITQTHRSKSYGRKVFQFVEQAYPSARRFRLEVRSDNERAVALYARLGYK